MSQALPYNNHSVVGSLDRLAASQSLGGKWELRFPPGLEHCYPLSGKRGEQAQPPQPPPAQVFAPHLTLPSEALSQVSGRCFQAALPGSRGPGSQACGVSVGSGVYVLGRHVASMSTWDVLLLVSVVLSLSGADPVSTEAGL